MSEVKVQSSKLKVLVTTWNCGNKLPADETLIPKWIPKGFDVYAVGTQENSHTDDLASLIKKIVGHYPFVTRHDC